MTDTYAFDELDDLPLDLADLESLEDKPMQLAGTMQVEYADPRKLHPNPWNPNQVDPINMLKLETSVQKHGIKRPIVVRELEDGTLQIIGGQHRTEVAIQLGMTQVPIINRGLIDDAQAKKETLIDNFRYGRDDTLRFSELLQDPDIGSAEELLATMPIDEEELAGYFSHLTSADLDQELDSLLDDSKDDEDDETIDIGAGKPVRTHQIIRFRVSIETAAKIGELIKKTKEEQCLFDSDDLTNDGDALVHLLRDHTNE